MPFEGETALQIVMQHINEVPIIPSAFVPGIPKGMDDIVMHAMSARISRRYESAEKMYEDMEVLRSDPNARFHYVASEDNSGETQIIGADIQRAARRSAAEHEAVVEGAAAPRIFAPARARRPAPAPVSAGRSRMSRTAFLKSWPSAPAWRSAWRSA